MFKRKEKREKKREREREREREKRKKKKKSGYFYFPFFMMETCQIKTTSKSSDTFSCVSSRKRIIKERKKKVIFTYKTTKK